MTLRAIRLTKRTPPMIDPARVPAGTLAWALGVWDAVLAVLPFPELKDKDEGGGEGVVDVVGWRYQSGRKGRHEPETLRSG
jgi:hypothetical protein